MKPAGRSRSRSAARCCAAQQHLVAPPARCRPRSAGSRSGSSRRRCRSRGRGCRLRRRGTRSAPPQALQCLMLRGLNMGGSVGPADAAPHAVMFANPAVHPVRLRGIIGIIPDRCLGEFAMSFVCHRSARRRGGRGGVPNLLRVPRAPHLLRRPQLCRARHRDGPQRPRAAVLLHEAGRCGAAGGRRQVGQMHYPTLTREPAPRGGAGRGHRQGRRNIRRPRRWTMCGATPSAWT
jgi:hypothetical protein